MKSNQRIMNSTRLLGLATIISTLVGCGIPEAMGCGMARSETTTYVDAARGIRLEYPSTWTIEELAEQNMLLLMSPVEEANWQTNMFVELRRNLETSKGREQRLATLTDNLSKQKAGFALQSSQLLTHSSGLPGAELLYTHDSQGVPLSEKELVLWLTDEKTLFVTGSAVISLWSKYESEMNVVFDSVRPLAP